MFSSCLFYFYMSAINCANYTREIFNGFEIPHHRLFLGRRWHFNKMFGVLCKGSCNSCTNTGYCGLCQTMKIPSVILILKGCKHIDDEQIYYWMYVITSRLPQHLKATNTWRSGDVPQPLLSNFMSNSTSLIIFVAVLLQNRYLDLNSLSDSLNGSALGL